jgi:hypothetical protein
MSDLKEEEVYLTAQDAMDEMGISRQTFFDYVKRGYIDKKKVPGMVARYPKSQCSINSIISRKSQEQGAKA